METQAPVGPRPEPAAVRLESPACPLDCDPADERLLQGKDLLHGLSGEFDVVECRSCGLMRTTPRPTLESIGAYYPEPYGPYQPRSSSPGEATVPTRASRFKQAWRLDGTRDLLPPISAGHALEIGCASGRFLAKLRDHGWQVRGIEPSPTAAQHARAMGFHVHVGPVETAPAPPEPLDLIVASHTLEHLHQPVESLRRLRAWAQPGAWFTCAIPDASSLLFRVFRHRWYDLDLPRHLFHFTPDSIRMLLKRTGWRVEVIKPQATSNSLVGSVGYALRERRGFVGRLGTALLAFPNSRSPLKPLASPLCWALTGAFQTGRIVVWAQAE